MPKPQMWFGTKEKMQWVPAPAVNPGISKAGWQSKTQYLNGGAAVLRSWASHKEYNLSWKMKSQAEVRQITDYADGVYGDGAIYWLDPFAMRTNLLPQMWGTPALAGLDGLPLSGDIRPTITATGANTYLQPTRTAIYEVLDLDVKRSIYIPCPPEYTLWVGAKGTAGTGDAAVRVTEDDATETELTLLTVIDPVLMNASFNGGINGSGITIDLTGNGVISLTSMCVQCLPTGQTPTTGAFISGQGHSGCQFESQPVVTPYNAAIDKVGLSIDLIETESWQ